jgi:hypothetical protein
MKIKGSCLCGAVQYEVDGPFTGAGHCHCPMCRKWSGSACGTWAFIAPGQFRWTAGEEFVERYESSPGNERCFCRRCGSPLAAAHGGKVSEVVLGSVDGDPMVRPHEHIFVAFKASWHEITDGLPQHREWPPELHADSATVP